MAAQNRHGRWTDSIPKIASIYGSIAVLATGAAYLLQNLYLDKYVKTSIEVQACSRETVDTLVHQHVDPIIDSLSVLNRKMLKQAIYQTVQMDEMLGPQKALKAEQKYLAIIKAMEAR